MVNITVNKSRVEDMYEFSVYLNGTTVDFGLVFKEDLKEIVDFMQQDLDKVLHSSTLSRYTYLILRLDSHGDDEQVLADKP